MRRFSGSFSTKGVIVRKRGERERKKFTFGEEPGFPEGLEKVFECGRVEDSCVFFLAVECLREAPFLEVEGRVSSVGGGFGVEIEEEEKKVTRWGWEYRKEGKRRKIKRKEKRSGRISLLHVWDGQVRKYSFVLTIQHKLSPKPSSPPPFLPSSRSSRLPFLSRHPYRPQLN